MEVGVSKRMSGFTVIVPAFGAVRTLERCLLSVIANSGPAHTVLLADDASPADPFDALSSNYGERWAKDFSLFVVTLILVSSGTSILRWLILGAMSFC